jgi:transporter family protein
MRKTLNEPTREVLLFSLAWALYIVQSKRAFSAGAKIVPFQIETALVALAALSIFMLPGVWREIQALLKETPKVFWLLFIGNGLHFGVGSTLYVIGVSQTDAINAGFLVKGSMVTTTLLAWIFLQERMSWRKIANLFLMMVGIYLLTTRGARLLPKAGDLYILGACLAWSVGNILIRQGLKGTKASANLASYLKPLAGLPVFVFLVVLLPKNNFLTLEHFSLAYLGYALLAGIFISLTWLFLNRSLKITTASYVTMLSTATPVFVSILAMLILHEQLVPIQALGGGLILLSGVFIYFSDMSYR